MKLILIIMCIGKGKMTNRGRRDAGLAYISDDSIFEKNWYVRKFRRN